MALGQKADLRVMIAMENGQAAKGARAIFKEQSAETFQIVSGKREALEKMQFFQFNLLLVEDSFSDLGGVDFVRFLRMNSGPISVAPIIFALKTPSRETVVEARDAGVNKMIVMPFTTASLLKNLADIMLNPRPFVQITGYDGPCRRLQTTGPHTPERRLEVQGLLPIERLQKAFKGA